MILIMLETYLQIVGTLLSYASSVSDFFFFLDTTVQLYNVLSLSLFFCYFLAVNAFNSGTTFLALWVVLIFYNRRKKSTLYTYVQFLKNKDFFLRKEKFKKSGEKNNFLIVLLTGRKYKKPSTKKHIQ